MMKSFLARPTHSTQLPHPKGLQILGSHNAIPFRLGRYGQPTRHSAKGSLAHMGPTIGCCKHTDIRGALCPRDSAPPVVGWRGPSKVGPSIWMHPSTGKLSHLVEHLPFKMAGRPAERASPRVLGS